MSDQADQKLNIEIEIAKTGTGGKEAKQEIDQVNESATALQKNFAAMNAATASAANELQKVKTASQDLGTESKKGGESVKELGKAEAEGAEHAEIMGLSHRELHAILHLIGHESGPAAGAALAGLGAAATGGVMLAVMAVRELFEFLKDSVKEAEELREKLEQKIDLSGLVGDVADINSLLVSATEQAAAFFAQMEAHAKDNSWKQAADEQIAQIERIEEAAKKIDEAQEKRDKKRLEFMKAIGQITEQQYQQALAAIDADAAAASRAAAADADKRTTGALSDAVNNAELEKHEKSPELEKLIQAAMDAGTQLEEMKTKLKTFADELGQLEGQLTDKDGKGLVDRLNELHPAEVAMAEDFLKKHPGISGNALTAAQASMPSDMAQAIPLLEAIADIRQQEANLAATIRDLRAGIPTAEGGKDTAEKNRDELQKHLQDLTDQIKALNEELTKRKAAGAVDKATTETIDVQGFASDAASIFQDLQIVQKYATSVDPIQRKRAAAALADAVSLLADAATMINEMAGLGDDVSKLKAQYAQLAAQIKQSSPGSGQ